MAISYDFSMDALWAELDDCNLKFVDTSAIRRYLAKCTIYATDTLLIAIVRRLDLDADAKLCKKEFYDGLLPIENYTKNSLTTFK